MSHLAGLKAVGTAWASPQHVSESCYNLRCGTSVPGDQLLQRVRLDRTDLKSLAAQQESRRWWAQQRTLHTLCISPEVIRELSDERFPNRFDALALVAECIRLDITDDVRGLSKVLVREKVMPAPAEEGDAVHVAACIVHQCDYLLTWNVRHLANPNKMAHLREVCRRVGFVIPQLLTPEYLWELPEGA